MREEEGDGELEVLPSIDPLELPLVVGVALPPPPHPVLGVTVIDIVGV